MREEGYYWVLRRKRRQIAEWRDDAWWFVGTDSSVDDDMRGLIVIGRVIEGEWK